MTSFPSKTSQPYTPPNHNYPSPSYPSSQGPYSYTRPNLSSPSSFNPYPSSLPGMSYPGSSSGYTTPFPTSGINQPTFSSPSTFSGPSFGNTSFPSFRPPSFESRMQQERMDRFNPSTGTPSWVNSASLPSHLSSSSYTRTNHNAGFSSPSLPTLDTSFLRYPTSMGSTPLSSSSLGISSFIPQPPSLSGRAYVASSSSQVTLPSNSFGISSFSPQPPSLSGRAHVPSLSGPQGTLPSRSYEITTWNPQSFSTERSPFIPSTFGKSSGSSSFSRYQPHFTSSFEKHIDLQRMLRLQFEEAIKTMYQVRPSPERPFPIWQTMGIAPFAIQIDHRTTVFVDPVTVTKFFQRASSDQQRAFRAQFDQLTSRRETFDPSEKRLSTVQQVSTFVVNALHNPRVQGSLQVLGGAAEVSAGVGITLGTGLIAAPIGHFVIVHGIDHVTTGLFSVVTGEHKNTATQLVLQSAGMPSEIIGLTDTMLSITGMGIVAKLASRLITRSQFRLPPPNLINNGRWILPKEGGGAFINGRWYAEHALERIAPRTPQVMAELEARALQRASAKGLQPGTDAFGEWMRSNGPAPRGVPISVVEAEIANPGSTNVCVVLNQKGEVITVITGGT